MPAPPTLPVLIADDTSVARAAVVRRLQNDGVTCLEVATAAAARAVDPARIACALLDLDLGDGNGVDVATEFLARRADLPIAFFTAGATAELQRRARAIAKVFAKPDDLAAAIAWVKSHA